MKAMASMVIFLSSCLGVSAQQPVSEPLAPPVPVLQRAKVTLDLHSADLVEPLPSGPAVVIWTTTPPILKALIDSPGPAYREMKREALDLEP
jgi:hypothetical protein